MFTNRRNLLAAGAAALGGTAILARMATAQEEDYPVSYSTEEWRERLSDPEFRVMRREGTEAPYSSPLDGFYEPGMYHCKGCDRAAYSSEHKYDSGTGWPSFWRAAEDELIATKTDYNLIYPRTEVHCATCGSHFGHIFEDGPQPTGDRHCLNGVALVFRPEGAGEPVVG